MTSYLIVLALEIEYNNDYSFKLSKKKVTLDTKLI